MRVPLGWLEEWIDLPASQDELMERLALGGLEIEGVERPRLLQACGDDHWRLWELPGARARL